MNIIMLNVHPEYQGRHGARSLLTEAEEKALAHGLARIVVAASNDDIPALYLYQRMNFVFTDVRPGAVIVHHGREEAGFANISVRDEIRLEKRLRS